MCACVQALMDRALDLARQGQNPSFALYAGAQLGQAERIPELLEELANMSDLLSFLDVQSVLWGCAKTLQAPPALDAIMLRLRHLVSMHQLQELRREQAHPASQPGPSPLPPSPNKQRRIPCTSQINKVYARMAAHPCNPDCMGPYCARTLINNNITTTDINSHPCTADADSDRHAQYPSGEASSSQHHAGASGEVLEMAPWLMAQLAWSIAELELSDHTAIVLYIIDNVPYAPASALHCACVFNCSCI